MLLRAQFKKLVCECLATMFCVRRGACGRPRNGRDTSDADDVQLCLPRSGALNSVLRPLSHRPNESRHLSSSSLMATEPLVGVTQRLLEHIRDLLQSAVRTMDRQRHDDAHNQQLMDDWMLAAAVIDRICFILITMFFVGGTMALVGFRYNLPH